MFVLIAFFSASMRLYDHTSFKKFTQQYQKLTI